MPGTCPTTFLSSKIRGDENCALRAIAVELQNPDWSVRRSKEGQPFCNSVSKADRAAELDRVLSLRGRVRAGWLELPEQRETQLEGLKDVFLNPDEFHALLGTMGSYSQHWSLYALTTELQRAQMRSWYVQIVGDNCPHNELIPLRGSLGSPQKAVVTWYFSVSTRNRWLFARTVSLGLQGCRDVVFSRVSNAKTPKFIFTSRPARKCSFSQVTLCIVLCLTRLLKSHVRFFFEVFLGLGCFFFFLSSFRSEKRLRQEGSSTNPFFNASKTREVTTQNKGSWTGPPLLSLFSSGTYFRVPRSSWPVHEPFSSPLFVCPSPKKQGKRKNM